MIRKYFKDASFLALTEGLLQLRGLVLMPFITRQFGPVSYGVWSQVSVLISTIMPLVVLGTDSAVLRYLPGKEKEQQKREISAWVLFLLGTAGLFAIILFVFRTGLSTLFFGEEGGDYVPFLSLAALWLISSTLLGALKNWFRVQNDAKLFGTSNLLGSALSVLAVVIMLMRNEGVYQLVVYSLLGDTLLIVVLALVNLFKYGWGRPDFSIAPQLVKYGLPLVPGAFAIWGLNYLDRFFIVQYSTLAELGIYTVAYRIAYQVIPLLVKPWFAMFGNSASELHNMGQLKTLQSLFNRSAGLTFALGIPASFGVFLLGDRVLRLFATAEFASGASLLIFISLGYLFSVMSSFYEIALGLIRKQYLSTVVSSIAFLVNLALNFLLIPRYGILGAAIATFSAFLAMLVISLYFASRFTYLKTDFAFVLKVILATLGMSIGIKLIALTGFLAGLNIILEIGIFSLFGLVFYASLLWVFGILSKREFRLAISLLYKQ